MKKDQPDIVWIYCDELRADALGCYGNDRITPHTPNIDRLAESGILFRQHFCNSPVCVPSRVCTLTGRPPEETGVYNNEGAWKNFQLPAPLLTFPPVFAQHGYATANFGKTHVARGMYPGQNPAGDIFQHDNPQGGGMSIWQHLGEEAVQMIRSPHGGMNGGIFPDDVAYPPQAVTDNGLAWIDQARSPYLARFSYLQPHTPVLPPASFVRLLADQDPGLPEPLAPTLSAYERRIAEITELHLMPPDKLRAARLHYHALVAWVDAQVGRLLDFLEKTGRREQTVILFGADHGNPIGDTGAFEKHTFAPCVHRVPLLLSWPGTVPAGQVREDVGDSLDIPRTLFGCAGIPAPPSFKGHDLLADPPLEASYSTIGYGLSESKKAPNGGRGQWYGNRGWPRRSCIRTDRFRLDKNMRLDGAKPAPADEDIFLADFRADPREQVNLAGDPAYAGAVRELSAMLDRHAERAVEVPPECVRR